MELAFHGLKRALWNDVIRDIYREHAEGWCLSEVRKGYGMGLWKAIHRWWPLVSKQGVLCGWEWEE